MATVDALKKKLDEYKPGAAIVMQVERSGHLLYIPIELE